MGGPRLVDAADRPTAQTFGDVLQEMAHYDPRAVKDLEVLARWKLKMLKVDPPPLRTKEYLRKR